MNFQPYPSIIERFLEKLVKANENQDDNQERSYHKQKISIGEQGVDYRTKLSIKFKMNCDNNKFGIINERFFQFQFKWKDSFTEAEIKEQYNNFQKLVKQVVVVATSLDKEMRELFKIFKPETALGKSSFIINVRFPQDYQAYWIQFQELLLSQFSKIQKEEIIVAKMSSDIKTSDLVPQDEPVNIFYSFLKNSEIEIFSLLIKLINEETRQILSTFTSDNLEEKKTNDLILMLYNLLQSEIDLTLDSFTQDELEQLGLFAFQLTPINLNFQPTIIHKIKLFFQEVLSGKMKMNMINSQTYCSIKLETTDDLSGLFDVFIQTNKPN